jgi:hypothetical protein
VLRKWKLCQDRIFGALESLGADPAARDATRVLRLVGTYNSKTGTLVESIWENLDDVWNFGDLSDEILPLTREELEKRRAERRRTDGELLLDQDALRGPRTPPERTREARKGFTPASLSKLRLNDLKLLMELRGWEKLPPGKRDYWMFVAGVCLSYLIKEPELLERELLMLGEERAGWSESETRSRMQAVLARARCAADGEPTEWRGQQRHALYYLKNETIIERLEITPEEERYLKSIISDATRRRRDRERKETKRRAHGVQPRDQYTAECRERKQHMRHEAQRLRGEGKSLRKIGEELGVSHTYVSKLLKTSE